MVVRGVSSGEWPTHSAGHFPGAEEAKRLAYAEYQPLLLYLRPRRRAGILSKISSGSHWNLCRREVYQRREIDYFSKQQLAHSGRPFVADIPYTGINGLIPAARAARAFLRTLQQRQRQRLKQVQ